MANQEHLDILKQGMETWNQWRKEYAHIQPDLSEADLSGANLSEVNLSGVNLLNATLENINFSDADLSGANLGGADLMESCLKRADLSGAYLDEAVIVGGDLSLANLTRTSLQWAFLRQCNLTGANLTSTNLQWANLCESDLSGANMTNCLIYGISAWDVRLERTIQSNLIITQTDEEEDRSAITIDNLKLAQFIYLLLNNAEIREVIDTITSKVVLILGRFTPERKAVLDALREELHKRNYSPVLFDFEKPASRDLTETISTLAHLARFIIVDLTDPSSTPHEVSTVIPHTVVPVQPVMLDGGREYSMFHDLRQRHHWVLPTHFYTDQAHLLATLKERVIEPAEQKAQELEKR